MDGWDCFGEAPDDAPLPKLARQPPSTAAAAAGAAVAFLDDVDVPAPPPAPDLATQGSGSISIWPDAPPVYTGPIRLSADDGVGGGRGFVAERDVQPGELLLLEVRRALSSPDTRHAHATLMPRSCHTNATLMPRSCHARATLMMRS